MSASRLSGLPPGSLPIWPRCGICRQPLKLYEPASIPEADPSDRPEWYCLNERCSESVRPALVHDEPVLLPEGSRIAG